MKQIKRGDILLNISKILSVAMIAALIIVMIFFRDLITVENIMKITPKSYFYASITLILLFFFKSLSIFFPVIILFVVSGIVLPPAWAIATNFIGIVVGNTFQYFIGRASGSTLKVRICAKYPKVNELCGYSNKNEWFVSYITRLIGFLPADIISLFLGIIKVNFIKYTIASIVGMTPTMICATFIGVNILNPLSYEFIISCAVAVLISAVSMAYYYLKKKGKIKMFSFRPKWVRIVFRRRVFVIFLILLQIAVIAYMIWDTSTSNTIFSQCMVLISYIVALYIINKENKPAYKLIWVVLMLAFPIFGGALYLMIRLQGTVSKVNVGFKKIEEKTRPLMIQEKSVMNALYEFDRDCYIQSRYLSEHKWFPVYQNSSAFYLTPGENMFEKLKEELNKASDFIFLEYFIIREGIMWNSILAILVKKVAEGVDVRVIYDDIGCFMLLAKNYDKKLESLGIKCILFNPFKPALSSTQNNRDHRKIAIIDGRVAFTGGINLADEYINAYEKHGHWKDSSIMIKGEAVWSFTMTFLQMWNLYRSEDEDFLSFKRNCYTETDGFIEPYADRPLDSDTVGEHVYMSIITRAKNYIYIMTPYLIIEDSILSALKSAAQSGVETVIITPNIPDKWYVHMTTRSYYHELIRAGVKIYEYTNGFMHSKIFLSDDKTATVGTTNLDYRSLYMHFEFGVLLHGCEAVKSIKNDFIQTLKRCTKIQTDDLKNNIFIGTLHRILRLFAPLM